MRGREPHKYFTINDWLEKAGCGRLAQRAYHSISLASAIGQISHEYERIRDCPNMLKTVRSIGIFVPIHHILI